MVDVAMKVYHPAATNTWGPHERTDHIRCDGHGAENGFGAQVLRSKVEKWCEEPGKWRAGSILTSNKGE